jgi:arylsulfatase A-like enzyme
VFAAFICFAIVAGLLEAGFLLLKWSLFNRFTWISIHALWMAPLANVALLLGPGLVVASIAAWRPDLVRLSHVTGLLVFGLVCCLLIVGFNGGLAIWSVVVLGLGLAIRAAMVVGKRADVFGRMLQRTAPRLFTLAVALAVILPGGAMARERFLMRELPPAGDRPNVLLIILDTVRAASLSVYGHQRPTTPRLEELARTSTVFDLAIAPAPWTLPSHGSMFTGRWPHELQAGWLTPFDDRFPTIAEILQQHGYTTAGFVANHFYTTRQSGLDRGFIHYEDIAITPAEILRSSLLGQVAAGLFLRGRYVYLPERSTHRKSAAEIRTSFTNWTSRSKHRPWFAFLNFFDAHKPYRVPASFARTGPGAQKHADGYEDAIRYIDSELGTLLDTLEQRGELDNTLIIITSDHGEQFGRHKLFGHGNSLYQRVMRIPLLIRYPVRVPAGARVSRPVSLRDIPRTVVDLVGIQNSSLPGISLAEAWSGSTSYPDTILGELLEGLADVEMAAEPPMYLLVTRDFQYIRQANGTIEIYNLPADPLERVNLADSASARGLVEQFGRNLDRQLSATQKQ